jgi:ubiquinone/menaquinone biosynthesis C-methylase UbiE
VATADEWDEGYRRRQASNLHAELLGEGMPSSVQPFSFVPLAGLEAMAASLALEPGQTLVDLGCGQGGPGLWLADRAGAHLVGVDHSGAATAEASRRQQLFGGIAGARFVTADVACTGLPGGCADAVVSVDVLQLVDNGATMLREAARLLVPDGRIALTSWEGWGEAPDRYPRDLPTLFRNAGLRVDRYTEQPTWLERQARIYRQAAAQDRDDPAVTALAEEGRRWQRYRDYVRRVVVGAYRSR